MFPVERRVGARGREPASRDVSYDMTTRRLAIPYLWRRGEPRVRTEVPLGPRAPPAPGHRAARADAAPAGAGALRRVRRQPDHPAPRRRRPGRRRAPRPRAGPRHLRHAAGDPARVPRELRAPHRRLQLGDERAGRPGRHQGAHPARSSPPRPRWPPSCPWTARPTSWSSSGCAASTASPTTSRTASCPPRCTRGPPRRTSARARCTSSCAASTRPTWRTRGSSSTSAPRPPTRPTCCASSPGSPLLVVRTTVRDSAGHPLVHSFSRLRPDVSQVEFEVSVGGR